MTAIAVDPAAVVGRTAFYLPGQGGDLFAFLHAAGEAGRGGVVLCPPVGYEQVHAHRTLRRLADELARAGLSVLRFDYHATGDSAGADEDPDRVATWLANVRDALAWLRGRLRGAPVSLFGLRLGAALALRAACEDEVESLVLWAPAAGRSFVREMKALAAAGDAAGGPAQGEIEAAGFVLTRQTAEALLGLDPLSCAPRCRRVLLASRDEGGEGRLHDHLAGQGCAVERFCLAGYAEMLAEPHFTRVPQEAVARTVAWLSPPPFRPSDRIHRGDRRGKAKEAELSLPHLSSSAVSGISAVKSFQVVYEKNAGGEGVLVRETPLTLRRQPCLFGVLGEPEAGPAADLPAVVLLNAGSAHRVGPGRLYVHLARRLAADGFRCLRLDLAGLGDSAPAGGARENDPYPATAFADIQDALDHLGAQRGVRRVVLMGLCAGAYAAFQAAVHLSSPLLVESVLINPLTFYWQDGTPLDAPAEVRRQALGYYLASALRPGRWLRLLSGRSRIGLAGAARLLLEHWRQRPAGRGPGLDGPGGLQGHPPGGDLAADLGRVARAGRRLTLVFARSDPGYGLLTFQAGRTVRRLRRAGALGLSFIDDADHTFSRRAGRGRLLDAIASGLLGRYAANAGGLRGGVPAALRLL
jgi:alpha-beta hydrolase superfamily lysophospholipase